jgi:hypothetical protein
MPRTFVAARGLRPERRVRWRHARAIPEGVTLTTFPFVTRHFMELANHCTRLFTRVECVPCSRGSTQFKTTIGFIFSTSRVPTERARTYCTSRSSSLERWETVWPHKFDVLPELLVHRLLTFTVMPSPDGNLTFDSDGSSSGFT